MTPLKQPIVVTIETVEEALAVYWRLNVGIDRNCKTTAIPQWVLTGINMWNAKHWREISTALEQAGINPNQKPPAPLTVAGHEVEALEGGAIKVGCTTVSRPTPEAILKLSSEAMVKAEPEFPKWYRVSWTESLIQFENATDYGLWHCPKTKPTRSCMYQFEDVGKDWRLLTPEQAREILEGNSKDQPK